MMNTTDFIEAYAKEYEMTKKDSKEIVNSVIDFLRDKILEGNEINFTGFGKFEIKTRNERNGRNPKTQETMVIPACKTPRFTFSKTIKDSFKNN